MDDAHRPLEVAVEERLQSLAHQLDVLLRHRPLSIALCSAGCQRHGTQEKSGSYRMLPRLEVSVRA
jgi:hypothetical protein